MMNPARLGLKQFCAAASMVIAWACQGAGWAAEMPQKCLRDSIPSTTPTEGFIDNRDGTVLHRSTGLMWMRCGLGQRWNGTTCSGEAAGFTWKQALIEAVNFNVAGGFAGAKDWRLPNIKELDSIVELQCYFPAINLEVFPATPRWRFWSSSPDFRHPVDSALFVNFKNGYNDDGRIEDTFQYHVRLVRGGHGLDAFDAKR